MKTLEEMLGHLVVMGFTMGMNDKGYVMIQIPEHRALNYNSTVAQLLKLPCEERNGERIFADAQFTQRDGKALLILSPTENFGGKIEKFNTGLKEGFKTERSGFDQFCDSLLNTK